ncbi:MAG: transglycosylase domain-containing protein [Nitrospinae bacterium]|nr:transglycosylase domain-containing protein [Nitrospinota bacterium]
MEKTPSRSWINRADRWLREKLTFLSLKVELCLGIAALLAVWLLSEVLPDARLAAPEPSLLVLDRQGRFLDEMESAKGKELGYWPLAALPPRVVAATTAAEDRRFFSHPGVDPLAVVRAAFQNWQSGRRLSGGVHAGHAGGPDAGARPPDGWRRRCAKR